MVYDAMQSYDKAQLSFAFSVSLIIQRFVCHIPATIQYAAHNGIIKMRGEERTWNVATPRQGNPGRRCHYIAIISCNKKRHNSKFNSSLAACNC